MADEPANIDLRELARRTVPRDLIDHITSITVASDMLDTRIIDISPYGFQARARGPILMRGERISVELPSVGSHEAHIMWGLKGFFGSKFIEPIETERYAEMLLTIRLNGGLLAERPSSHPAYPSALPTDPGESDQ